MSRRILHDVQMLSDNDQGIILIDAEDLRNMHVCIQAPSDTPYKGGMFELIVSVPQTYPWDPPEISFKTRIFHPNISVDGTICVDILSTSWKAGASLLDALVAVQGLLQNPNGESPLNVDASLLLSHSKEMFDMTAQAYTKVFAGGVEISKQAETKIGLLETLGITPEQAVVKLGQNKWRLEQTMVSLNLT